MNKVSSPHPTELIDALWTRYTRIIVWASNIGLYIPDPTVDPAAAEALSQRVPFCTRENAALCKVCTLMMDWEVIVWYAGIETSQHQDRVTMMRYVWVDPAYGNRWIAKELLESCVAQAIALWYRRIDFSEFTTQGEQYLPRMLLRLQQKYHRIDIMVKDMVYSDSIGIDTYCRRYVCNM